MILGENKTKNKIPFFRIKGGVVNECREWFGCDWQDVAASDGVVKSKVVNEPKNKQRKFTGLKD